jgi:hypothetical protein
MIWKRKRVQVHFGKRKRKRKSISIRQLTSPGKTPANPSAFSINSSTGRAAMAASLSWPSNEEEGYMFVPIPSLLPVSLAIAS